MSNSIIKDVVDKFVAGEALFTSVDIANEVKKSGTWLSNSDVAFWLRNEFSAITLGYTNTIIQVLNGTVTARLYHPINGDISDYTTAQRNQEAVTYKDFIDNYKDQPASAPTPSPVVDVTEKKIVAIVANVMNLDVTKIDTDSTLTDLSFDDLDIVELILEIEEEFDVEIASDDVEASTKLSRVIELVKEELSDAPVTQTPVQSAKPISLKTKRVRVTGNTVKIPKCFVEAVGLYPGDEVDDHTQFTFNDKTILQVAGKKVTVDGRVMFNSRGFASNGEQIEVAYENGTVKLTK